MFKKDLLDMVLSGRKTQTRRRHKNPLKEDKIYAIKRSWYESTGNYIRITKIYSQKLGDVTPEEAEKEGFRSVEQFTRAWTRINGDWNPDEIVTVYEFILDGEPRKRLDSGD